MGMWQTIEFYRTHFFSSIEEYTRCLFVFYEMMYYFHYFLSSFDDFEHLCVQRLYTFIGQVHQTKRKIVYCKNPIDGTNSFWKTEKSYPIGLVFKETNNETRSNDGSWPSAVRFLLLLSPSPFKIETESIKKNAKRKGRVI